ncbi:MAG: hypothetical protein RI885_677 [Actinomycetota bacterium]
MALPVPGEHSRCDREEAPAARYPRFEFPCACHRRAVETRPVLREDHDVDGRGAVRAGLCRKGFRSALNLEPRLAERTCEPPRSGSVPDQQKPERFSFNHVVSHRGRANVVMRSG